jgi:hypothetical protein
MSTIKLSNHKQWSTRACEDWKETKLASMNLSKINPMNKEGKNETNLRPIYTKELLSNLGYF